MNNILYCIIFTLFCLSAEGQCPYGEALYDVKGNASDIDRQNGVSDYADGYGVPDGVVAEFYDTGDSVEYYLNHTVLADLKYKIFWKQRNDADTDVPQFKIYESIEGVTWFKQPAEPTTTNKSAMDSVEITANSSTRYVRIVYSGAADFEIDAISYDISECVKNKNPTNRIYGTIFSDSDGDGSMSGGEAGISSQKVYLYEDVNKNGQLNMGTDVLLDSTMTAAGGTYFFNVPSLTKAVINQVLTSADDAEEDVNSGQIGTAGTDNDFGYVGAGSPYMVGLRFDNIDIPQGTTIYQAYLKLVASSTHSTPVSLTVYFEESDDPTSFTETYGVPSSPYLSDLTNRIGTGPSVSWPNVEPWFVNRYYSSPDIQPIVQALVDRSGWNFGNAMVIIVDGGTNKRESFSVDAGTNLAPLLIIDTVGTLYDNFIVSATNPSASTATTATYRSSAFNWCDMKDTVPGIGFRAWALPLEWLEFEVVAWQGIAKLTWETISEYDNDRFIIERRSSFSDEFSAVGQVLSNGNSVVVQDYEFLDNLSGQPDGDYYYRISSVDLDGQTDYSPVRVFNLNRTTAIQFFPNPSQVKTTLYAPGFGHAPVNIEVFNAQGKQMMNFADENDNAEFELYTNNLSEGIYFVRISGSDGMLVGRLSVVRSEL